MCVCVCVCVLCVRACVCVVKFDFSHNIALTWQFENPLITRSHDDVPEALAHAQSGQKTLYCVRLWAVGAVVNVFKVLLKQRQTDRQRHRADRNSCRLYAWPVSVVKTPQSRLALLVF